MQISLSEALGPVAPIPVAPLIFFSDAFSLSKLYFEGSEEQLSYYGPILRHVGPWNGT